MTHRRQNFMGGAAILAGAVAVTKLLGALYKIPLGNLLDREGMAHFYAAYNIYSLLLVLSTAGLPVALSRMVSRAAAQRRYGAVRRCLHLGLALLAALGLVCSAVMCLLPEALAAALPDPDAAPALRTLGPAVLLVCLSAALRGYSQGLGDMVPTAAGQVAESAGKLLIGLGCACTCCGRVRGRTCAPPGPSAVSPPGRAWACWSPPCCCPGGPHCRKCATYPRQAAAYCGSCCGPAYPSPWARRA